MGRRVKLKGRFFFKVLVRVCMGHEQLGFV